MVVLEINVIPIGTEGPSLSSYVAGALEVLEDSNLDYELTSSGTIIEGDLDEALDVAQKMHESVFSNDVFRVVTNIQIDDRRDKELSIKGKKDSVKEKLS